MVSSPSRNRAHNGPAAPRATSERRLFPLMKLILPFDLIPHLEGSGIAASFGLKSSGSENHTVVDLKPADRRDLLFLLKSLESDLNIRCQKMQKHASRSPLPVRRRSGLEHSREVVRRSVELIEASLA